MRRNKKKNIPKVEFSEEMTKSVKSSARKYVILSIFSAIYLIYAITIPFKYNFFSSLKQLADANGGYGWYIYIFFLMPQLFALAIGWDYTFDFIRVLSLDPLYSTFGYRADYSRNNNAHIILDAQVLLTFLTIFSPKKNKIFFRVTTGVRFGWQAHIL